MPGKTPMWGNPTREREIYYSAFRKVQYNNKYTFPAKENTSQPQKNSPKNYALENVPKSVQLYGLLQICASKKHAQQSVVRPAQYDPTTTRRSPENASVFHAKGCLENRAQTSCCTDCTDPYSTAQHRKMEQHTHRKLPWDLCPLSPWEMCPPSCSLSSLKLTQKISLTQLLSLLDVSCTLPNAFFYKSENDIFPPKCLFTFPNPKSKGQD
jgi:hypothetical protein